ncbi:glycerophosphodiester phosphodiesterase [Mageeibacillus indolicus]|uniref:glycerophosphodiester phosphodiesterase n=1 Tax=Mageeibacillus indolicus TaxID=884684 RepID=UPI0004DD54A5|nr:glycerophosphodiester phosphodiesterase [Mageeibacillus indolicus]KFA57750.1 hypothetical protein HMPREF1632_01170 [Mageeibacillus indolicus 0009-5]
MQTKILAHRGASAYAPENTMAAFELAHQMHADGLEIDVHLTKDQVLVVAHDEDIKRVSDGSGLIKDYTLNELRHFNFANGYSAQPFYQIPTLNEVLELVKATGMILNIELKNSIIFYPELEERTLKAVHDMKLDEQIIYSSFNHYSVVKMKHLGTTSPCGLLYDSPLYMPWRYADTLGVDALHPHYKNLMIPDYVKESHARKLQVNPWTVNERNDMQRLYTLGVDSIITNHPDIALEVRTATTK